MTNQTDRRKLTKQSFVRPAALWLLILCCLAVPVQSLSAAKVNFRWAVLADSSEGMRPLDFTGSPVVFSGTALQIYLEHLDNCYIYLYLLDFGDNLTPLYPAKSSDYDYGFPRGPKLIPPGEQSFTFVPPTGIETLLLIGSAQRLFQLEKLTEEFNRSPDQMGQQKLLLDLIGELIDSKEKLSRAAEDQEKVTVKYKTAGGIQERRFKATEVNISDLYGRRLLIDHR